MSTAEALVPEVPEWTFGDRLRKARRHGGLNQAELAVKLGVSTARLSNWEAGYNLPRDLVRTAGDVASATGVPQEWLLGLGQPPGSRCFPELSLVRGPDVVQGTLDFDPPVLTILRADS